MSINYNQFLQQAQTMQKKMQEMQSNLTNNIYEGKAGAGLVSLTINGKTELQKINIDTSLLKVEEKEMLEDLIIAAFNDAKLKADQDSQNSMHSAFGNIGLPAGMKFPF